MYNKIYVKIKDFIKNNYKFLVLLTFLIFMFYYEFPYIIYKSGGTINLDDRVIIDTNYDTDGSLSMSYVTAIKGTPVFILASFIMPDWDLIPLSDITGDDGDYNTVLEQGKEYLNEGIDNAIISAFREAGYGLKIKETINKVIYISDKADTDIVIGDRILEINEVKVNDLEDVKKYVNTLKENDIVMVKVLNDNKEYERTAKIYLDTDNTLKIGIAFKITYDYETEIPVTIKMKDKESGSSGGLMMALAIYNSLVEEDITNGLNIVGTGSINNDGTVSEIGGVKYKVLASVEDKADIFLCPKENYEEAIKIKEKRNLNIEIVSVSTLSDAINYLKNIK